MVGIYIFIVICVMSALFLLTATKPKQKKNISSNEEYMNAKRNIDELNHCIDKYNNIIQTFEIKFNNKKNECIRMCDSNSLSMLGDIEEEYERLRVIAENTIINAKSEIEHNFYCMDSLKSLSVALSSMKNLTKSLDEIFPEYQRNEGNEERKTFTENYSSKSNPTSAYFSGCKTKEEADRRYKALAKAFHPDMGCGDEKSFIAMQKEYDGLSF